ncbi:hypothetical protein [Demequina zhanjiangensis]|uniref:Uncharacterized protein n=1 Tax=Demequina zhanjiangensis TaxID=3051659 RepID=A0ABT8G5E1_9MICO|nr:hypothetical protein [Demequina sp. SYSU T00b26]MDN4474144.1 hypothetical protein [Demequina sp. SYSU T00b26]
MSHEAKDDEAADEVTEALPTTRELPVTQPLPAELRSESDRHVQAETTQVIPVEPTTDAPNDAPPPSIPPRGTGPTATAPKASPTPAPHDARPGRPAPLLIGALAVIAVLAVAGLTLGATTLLGDRGQVAAAAPSESPTPSVSATTSGMPASPTPSETSTDTGLADTVGVDGSPGSDGACTAEVRKEKAKDGEFKFDVRVKARAGGVETWEVRVDIGDAAATEVKDAILVGQKGGVVTLASADGAEPIASGKHTDLKVEGTGEPSGLAIACDS